MEAFPSREHLGVRKSCSCSNENNILEASTIRSATCLRMTMKYPKQGQVDAGTYKQKGDACNLDGIQNLNM